MLGATNFITRHAFNFLISFTLFTVFALNLNMEFVGFALLFGGYYVSNLVILNIQKSKRSKALGITKADYNLIEAQLKQARDRVNQLSQQRVRSIKSFRLLNDMSKVSRRLLNIVDKNPHKFYAVEDFFYSHLPSAVELADKYTLLTKEQVKGTDIHLALEETRKTLKVLNETFEDDLRSALQSDIDHLKIELDFAKLEHEKRQERLSGGDH
ncbi:5-bromo-4-chloroindolyl phosphate hydrolysis family protein [Lysinibacillus odysseyi]|uniref:5-bromo-4-chloroindolyl phosphate hydrolase n=1 Tax=Lysinibacillus odysseyi 34hs-1 = NBRC 100172 TaxID=1220589 RepID=A0A0A3IAV9_9BACI|nr:5-bromo-4-chloroindolyl phosphate hydrolysis family protein [Lysinibacillus odysseyi]KGR81834.1 5-bromo-4-chloroindolyl phosphate hydrolase [Lysinibacillus odysseyi 34hs-1 = NBRC 100172]